MRSSIAKSIYVGAAVLGLAGLSAVTTTTASAKSYATAGAYTALADKSQNVTVTGTNAIYSKPGTVKGAKVVASKATVTKLAASKKSSDTFYAYGTKTTNRGSVYYKIVTMDKKYRGYVYAGKTAGTFTAGIKAAETMTAATTPARTNGYYLKDVSKNTLWTAPKNTDIHAKKISLYGVGSTDAFKVDKAATKTKEGTLYYHVVDEKNAAVSGWIYAGKGYNTSVTNSTKQDLGGLSLTMSSATATPDNSVKVVYRDGSKTVATSTWVNSPATTTAADATKAGNPITDTMKDASGATLAQFAVSNIPVNHVQNGAIDTKNVTFGNTLYVNVAVSATSQVRFVVDTINSTGLDVNISNPLKVGDTITSKDFTAHLSRPARIALSGKKDTPFSKTALEIITDGITVNDGTKTYYATNGEPYHYSFEISGGKTYSANNTNHFVSDNRIAYPGDILTSYLTAKLVKGAANTAITDNTWIA